MVSFREIVIWAHSECRSTMALFREVARQSGVPVTVALWKHGNADDVRALRESQGQRPGEFADLGAIPVGEDLSRGRSLLADHCGPGVAHVFCVYQNSPAWRRLICEAKATGSRVAVYAEAPCPMCVGPKATLKRLYYRAVLPFRLRRAIRAADVLLCASGPSGKPSLLAIGWPEAKIVPFGYASALPDLAVPPSRDCGAPLRILHTGIETAYRSLPTLLRACAILKGRGIPHELFRTGGAVSTTELARLYASCDILVACGLCEPWGIRVNDAIHAGLPAVVSRGMGSAWMVGQAGCGFTYAAGNARELARILESVAADRALVASLRPAVAKASADWAPVARAKVFLSAVEQ